MQAPNLLRLELPVCFETGRVHIWMCGSGRGEGVPEMGLEEKCIVCLKALPPTNED